MANRLTRKTVALPVFTGRGCRASIASEAGEGRAQCADLNVNLWEWPDAYAGK
jgi:hypothetical protein